VWLRWLVHIGFGLQTDERYDAFGHSSSPFLAIPFTDCLTILFQQLSSSTNFQAVCCGKEGRPLVAQTASSFAHSVRLLWQQLGLCRVMSGQKSFQLWGFSFIGELSANKTSQLEIQLIGQIQSGAGRPSCRKALKLL